MQQSVLKCIKIGHRLFHSSAFSVGFNPEGRERAMASERHEERGAFVPSVQVSSRSNTAWWHWNNWTGGKNSRLENNPIWRVKQLLHCTVQKPNGSHLTKLSSHYFSSCSCWLDCFFFYFFFLWKLIATSWWRQIIKSHLYLYRRRLTNEEYNKRFINAMHHPLSKAVGRLWRWLWEKQISADLYDASLLTTMEKNKQHINALTVQTHG